MRTISQRELRNDSGRVLRELQAGQVFQVTVHGRPIGVLRLDPPTTAPQRFVELDGEPAVPGAALSPEDAAAWKADIHGGATAGDDDLRDPHAERAPRGAGR